MSTAQATKRARLLTIGAVCDRLKGEFPDISISKIRYLEGEGLVTPQRTRGGYRLFGEEELERLERILRLQRDEFLPLKVIREELEKPTSPERRRRRASGLRDSEEELDQASLCERAGIDRGLARELEEYGLLAPRVAAGERFYTETDTEIASICGRLASFGIAPRHLRTFRTLDRPRDGAARGRDRAGAPVAQPGAAAAGDARPAGAGRARTGSVAAPLLARSAPTRKLTPWI